EEKLRFLKASAPRFAPLLKLVRRAKPEGFLALLSRLWKRMHLSQKRLLLGLSVFIAGGLLIPVEEKISASAALEPKVRRVVSAPFQATLRETKVEAGDLVLEGEVLAELDGREIRFQLAEAVANRARAEKEADQALDAGKVAEAQMARLEALSHEQQQRINEERQKFLEVRSPIAGVVLQGDLERAEGAPLQTGDRLFEIAPIEEMLIEVALPQSEIAHVREGMKVEVQLEAYPGETFSSEITRIPPRSEIRQNANVFICEANLSNGDKRLRPGMNGEAKIAGDRKIFLWTLLRPAVNYCRLKLWL
ncbi:MAG: efflux RND transporter periplasmic adaptor subunit, partial [Verrucomicrobiota bacterium]